MCPNTPQNTPYRTFGATLSDTLLAFVTTSKEGSVMSNSRSAPVSGLAVGVTLTAAVILIIGGVLHAMQGVVGLATNEFYVTTQKWIFQFDVTTWGWIHVIVGIIAVLAGIGLFSGAVWARTLGVVIAR